MKKTLFFIASVLALISCTKAELQNEVCAIDAVADVTGFFGSIESQDTKTALDGFSIIWQSTDLISINGAKYSVAPNEIPTTAGFTYVEGPAPVAPYWAIYPYEGAAKISEGNYQTIIPVMQDYLAGGFGPDVFPMIAVGEGKELSFKNAASVLRITPSTIWKGVQVRRVTVSASTALAGTIAISYDGTGTPSVSATGSKQASLDCPEGVDFDTPLDIVVAPGTYSNLTVEVIATNGGSYSVSAQGDITINRSVVAKINVTADELVCDLSNNIMDTPSYPEAETANCYVIKKSGSYKFPVNVKGNGTVVSYSGVTDAGISDVASCEALWAVGCFKGLTFQLNEGCDEISFTLPNEEVPAEGNALVAVKNASGEILWSWHLWCQPEFKDVKAGKYTMGNVPLGHMTYNGAKAACGYQGQRKDPFFKTFLINQSYTTYYTKTTEQGTVEESIKNPTKAYNYLTVDGIPWNDGPCARWYAGGNVNSYTKYKKSMFDPCPPGYRIPGREFFVYFYNNREAGTQTLDDLTLTFYPSAIGSGTMNYWQCWEYSQDKRTYFYDGKAEYKNTPNSNCEAIIPQKM